MVDVKRLRDQTRTVQFKAIDPAEPIARDRKAFLTVIRGGGRDLGLNTVVEAAVLLGRGPDCDLTLHDMGISWHHARVSKVQGESFTVEDLGSTNGTFVNGILVKQPWSLRDGEKIFLGETVVRFALADEMEVGFQVEVAQLVGTDPLTGLESKRRFDDALDYALEWARRMGRPLSVLMMDMDGIKAINDAHGHLFGAHAIGRAGQIIQSVMGKVGHACRFGGDEFTVFLPSYDKASAGEIAEKIRAAVENARMEKDGVELRPTMSIGVASYPEDGDKVLELIAAADQALYRAKAQGKNRVAV